MEKDVTIEKHENLEPTILKSRVEATDGGGDGDGGGGGGSGGGGSGGGDFKGHFSFI